MSAEPPEPRPPSSSASTEARKGELEPLVQAWARGEGSDAAGASEPGAADGAVAGDPNDRLTRLRGLKNGLDIRIAITVVLMLMAVIVMIRTRHGLVYFFASGTPTDLGDVRDRHARGDKALGGTHDTYVKVTGLVPTRLIGVAPEGADPTAAAIEFVFYCPLYDVVVLSKQRVAIPPAGWSEFDPRLKDLVLQGVADPAETMVSWVGEGRLLRGSSAPAELRPFVSAFARRLDKRSEDMWVLVEGQAPSHYLPTFILWLVALVPTVVSVVFYLRARRVWERAVETGPPV